MTQLMLRDTMTHSVEMMTQSTQMTHFSIKNDTIDENDTFFKKNDTILSSKSCFLNGNKRKVKFQFSTSRKATN